MHERWDFSFHSTAMKLCPMYLFGAKVLCLLPWQFIPGQPNLNCPKDNMLYHTMPYCILPYIYGCFFSWICAFQRNNAWIAACIYFIFSHCHVGKSLEYLETGKVPRKVHIKGFKGPLCLLCRIKNCCVFKNPADPAMSMSASVWRLLLSLCNGASHSIKRFFRQSVQYIISYLRW